MCKEKALYQSFHFAASTIISQQLSTANFLFHINIFPFSCIQPVNIFRMRNEITAFIPTAALLLEISPVLSIHAANISRYPWNTASKTIAYADLSAYFGDYVSP